MLNSCKSRQTQAYLLSFLLSLSAQSITCGADTNLDFSSSGGSWRITNDASPRQAPAPKPQVKKEKWIPIYPGGSNAGTAGAAASGSLVGTCKTVAPAQEIHFDAGPAKKEEDDDPVGLAFEKKALDFVNAKNYKQGLDAFRQAANINPHRVGNWYNMGVASQQLSRWDDAQEFFQKAISVDGSFEKARLELARTYINQGEKDKGLSILNELKWKVGAGQKVDKGVDGLLVSLGDERAALTPSMLANAKDGELINGTAKLYDKHPELAVSLAKELQRRHPNNADLEANLGKCYYKCGKYSEALPIFKRVAEIDPTRSEIVRYIISCCTQLGMLEDILNWKKEYVSRYPDDSYTPGYQQHVEYYKKDFDKTKQREEGKETGPVSSDRPRFDRKDMPLRVFVPDWTSSTSGWTKQPDSNIDYMGLLERACTDWSTASSGRVSFLIVSNSDDANIAIDWVGDPAQLSHSFAAGTTSFSYNAKGKPMAKIALLIPTQEKAQAAQDYFETCLHELGHALGLSHSSSTDDIMYFSELHESGSRSLSATDQKRISQLYR